MQLKVHCSWSRTHAHTHTHTHTHTHSFTAVTGLVSLVCGVCLFLHKTQHTQIDINTHTHTHTYTHTHTHTLLCLWLAGFLSWLITGSVNYCGCFWKHLTSCQSPPLSHRPACCRSPSTTERHEREREERERAGSQSSCRERTVSANTEGGFNSVNMSSSPAKTQTFSASEKE